MAAKAYFSLRSISGLKSRHHFRRNLCISASTFQKTKVCVVGSGPGGFYTAQMVLKNPNVEVDILEKLPVPFGLVRYGVAPDHPDVKNVINTFSQTASNDRCNFYGNIAVGKDISLKKLMEAYHAVVLSYGADDDRLLNIPGENLKNVISARSFVGWYNGHPSFASLPLNLDIETAVIIGMGNVALDVARLLLSPIHILEKTDINQQSLEALKKSKVRKVILVGRRGPLYVAFTIKEIREMINLPECQSILHCNDFEPLTNIIATLPRPRKRLLELLSKTALEKPTDKAAAKNRNAKKDWELKFFRRPIEALPSASENNVESLILGINAIEEKEGKTVLLETEEKEIIKCGLVLRSIGYKSIQVDPDIPFEHKRGMIPNVGGRVTGKKGLYCSGWVKTGPVGVIVSTMNSSFETGKAFLEDLDAGIFSLGSKPGSEFLLQHLNRKGISPVTFDCWKKIDKAEQEQGKKIGKPREKVTSIEKMLKLAEIT